MLNETNSIKGAMGAGQQSARKEDIYKVKTERFDLPSDGKLYPSDNPLSAGYVELYYPTAKTEDILTSIKLIQKGIVLEEFLKSLIVNPLIDINTLLTGDRDALLIYARGLAYGTSFQTKISCPKCNEENSYDIDISEFEIKNINFDDFDENLLVEFTLPLSKIIVKYKLLTQQDETAIAELNKKTQKENKRKEFVSRNYTSDITNTYKLMIKSVNGDASPFEINRCIETMPLMDSKALREHMLKHMPGLDTKFNYSCADCGHEERMVMPIERSFFWPDTNTD